MAYIQAKIKGKKIVSFKFKTCLGRDANGKQIFKCWTWHPPVDLTPAKARKEADRVADRWEAEQRLAYSQQKAEEPSAPPAPVYTFDTFVNEVWIPLCVRDGSHRPDTVAMYTNILKVILPQFKGVPLEEITGVRISQYLRWLRNDYRKPDGKPLAEKSIKDRTVSAFGSLICPFLFSCAFGSAVVVAFRFPLGSVPIFLVLP